MKFSVLISVDPDARPIDGAQLQRIRDALPQSLQLCANDMCAHLGGVVHLTTRARSSKQAAATAVPAFAQVLDSALDTDAGMHWWVFPDGLLGALSSHLIRTSRPRIGHYDGPGPAD